MPTIHSFYLPPGNWHEPFVLTEAEAHHLVNVLRIKTGATVRLFDGQGRHGTFTITAINKKHAELQPVSILSTPPQTHRVTLAAGFSKALRRSWFLEKAVELQAHAIWLWQGDYSQATIPEKEKNSWNATLINAAKQCESLWLPGILTLANGLDELTTRLDSFEKAFFLYEGDTGGVFLKQEDVSAPGDILLIVGPEGGFSPREVDLLHQARIPAVSLGGSILRWETAAVLTLGIAWWARQQPS